jgi:general secretion pathway protein A
MYCSFYGIAEKPFSITPDPKFLYLGKTHKEAFAHLLYGIRERGGFIVITGEIGAGKTTLCRGLLRHLDEDTLVAFIFNPTLSALELLKSINEDFGIPSQGTTKKELIDQLNRFLLEKRREGKNTVLIIDEAQSLDGEVLEQIRLLSNLETETEKLLQIILIGQPEFRHILEEPRLLQLNQRVTVRYHLGALSQAETAEYIRHRLSVIDASDKIFFSPDALKRVWRHTKGVPRLINVLCDRALLAGYGQRKKHIDGPMIDRASREVTGRTAWAVSPTVGRAVRRGLVPASLLGVFLVLLAIVLRDYLAEGPKARVEESSAEQAAVSEEGSAPEAPVPGPGVPHEGETPVLLASNPGEMASTPEPPPPEEAEEPRPEAAGDPAAGGDPDETASTGSEQAEPMEETPLLEAEVSGDASAGIEEQVLSSLYGKPLLETREEAFLAVLGKWDSGLSREEARRLYRGTADLFTASKAVGYQCLRLWGNINRLRALNLPALLELRLDKNMTKRYVALLAFEGGSARIAPPLRDGTSLVPLGVLEPLWYGTAYVLWRDEWGEKRYLAEGMKGGTIAQMQSSLRDLGYYSSEPSGVFDPKTAEALMAFQRDHLLEEDGILGPQTRIVLYQASKRYKMPTLDGAS